jgi:ADP-ribose pyrophosphatase YjhB (NUDIX family)
MAALTRSSRSDAHQNSDPSGSKPPQAAGRMAIYCRQMIEDTAHWPSGPVRIAWHGSNETDLPITGAHGFCFHEGQVLVCDISGRGPTRPGGHLDENESATDCLIRETFEEACVKLTNLRLLGFVEADHRTNKEFDGRYPIQSVQAIYRADVCTVFDFDSQYESTERRFVTPDELPSVHHEWNAVLQEALNAAIEMDGR